MRYDRILKLSLPLAMLGALAAVGGADDATPTPKNVIPLPTSATNGVVRGDHFFAVADGHILDVDLKQKKAKTCDGPDAKLLPFIDVADGKACVASDGKIHVVDLASGKTLHSAESTGDVRGLGFIDADRVYAITVSSIVVVDVTAGKTLQTIEVAKVEKGRHAGGLNAAQRVKNRLYVTGGSGIYESGLTVIDLDGGKVLDRMNVPFWCGGLQVVGDKAFLHGVNMSYGINSHQFGWVDLKTMKYTALRNDLKDRVPDDRIDQLTLSSGGDEESAVVLAGADGLFEYNSDGFLLARAKVKDCGRLLGMWNQQALTGGKDSLVLTPLMPAACRAD